MELAPPSGVRGTTYPRGAIDSVLVTNGGSVDIRNIIINN